MPVEDKTRPADEAQDAGEAGEADASPQSDRSVMHPRVRSAAFRAAKKLGVEAELQRKLETPPE